MRKKFEENSDPVVAASLSSFAHPEEDRHIAKIIASKVSFFINSFS